MTDVGESLLAGIIEDPADDTPRLIYADWLEENGWQPERVEFIRVQVELAKYPQEVEWLAQMPVEQWAGPEDEGRLLRRLEPLRLRQLELLEAHGRHWLPLPSNNNVRGDRAGFLTDGGSQGEFTFHRGFVEEVSLPCADWLKCGQKLVKVAPLWPPGQAVRLTGQVVCHPDLWPGWLGFWKSTVVKSGAAYLPAALWDALAGYGEERAIHHGTFRGWRTEAAALEALSAACLAWAKERKE